MNPGRITVRAVPLAASLAVVAGVLGGCAQQAKDGVQEIKQTNATMCDAEYRNVSTAVESFTLLVGHTPTEDELVPDYLLVNSPYYDIDATGKIVPSPGGGCG